MLDLIEIMIRVIAERIERVKREPSERQAY